MEILLKLIITKIEKIHNFLAWNFSLLVWIIYFMIAHITLLVSRKTLGEYFIEYNCNSQPLSNQFNNNFQMYLMDDYTSN